MDAAIPWPRIRQKALWFSGAWDWWQETHESFSWHRLHWLAVAASAPILDAWPCIRFQIRSWFGGRAVAVISEWQLSQRL